MEIEFILRLEGEIKILGSCVKSGILKYLFFVNYEMEMLVV